MNEPLNTPAGNGEPAASAGPADGLLERPTGRLPEGVTPGSTEGSAEQPRERPTGRPALVPDKFWDAATNSVRVDDLAKSYRELERRLGSSLKLPDESADEAEIARFRQALGVPEDPDGYELQLDEESLEADPDVNRRLHEAGFSQSQAQLVYDLAREYIGPMVQQTAADFEAERQTERLQQHFGGAEAWTGISRQLREWGKANLAPEALGALSTTYEGCLALHKMMQSHEPGLVRSNDPAERDGTDELKAMMRDPRYWRDRDPAFIRQVTDGFSRLYAEGDG